jgi:ATP-dependent RNA helicase DeaD
MLSMGFKKELDRILEFTQGNRNTWLFSATFPNAIRDIVKTYMSDDYQQVEINKESLVNENISHEYILTSVKNKFNTLVDLLISKESERGIIFCRTKLGTQKLAAELQEEGFSVAALEGDMQQKERDKVMRAFRKENLQYIVSTDVSARGIDVRNLGFVIHHQLPEKQEYYTHRSGRTARAGKKGNSIALISHTEMQQIYDLQDSLGILFAEV